jgi:nicotinate-nucleotide adenylyltransferase
LRYGILGGSFDPIHLGHTAAAEAVLARRGLDAVLLVPAGHAPHKGSCAAPFADRMEMARLAVRGRARLEVLDLEGARGGISYTIDTLEELRRLRPRAAFELLVGADMLADLPAWRRAEEVVSAAIVVGFGRPGAASEAARQRFGGAFGRGRHVWLDFDAVPVSSTEIRRRLSAGEPVGGLLDPAVEAFLRGRGLYGTRRAGGPDSRGNGG